MFIDVKLISGLSKPLTYKVPEKFTSIVPGTLVRVPLRNKQVSALVTKIHDQDPETNFVIKEISGLETFSNDLLYFDFLKRLSSYYALDEIHFIKRIKTFLQEKTIDLLDFGLKKDETIKKIITLTDEQALVVNALQQDITNERYAPSLLHGVTGSGKTEVYKQLIQHTFNLQKTTFLLLPEVSLALQFEKILRAQLPSDIPLFSFHSGTTLKNKQVAWHYLLHNTPCLIIGVHIPIILPCVNLGLIIIDEEHETGFQEKNHPKLNTKQVALLRAQHYKIPILLGSATPSVASLYNIDHKGWKFFQLKKRFSGGFPKLELVSLTDKKERKNFWISDILYKAIIDCLNAKKQAIIFLNRRGVCFFIQCKACAFIFSCSSCSVSLTLHEDDLLHCHYCNYQRNYPTECTSCKAVTFLKKGIGTEQIITILKALFPRVCIAKADLDATSNKKKWAETLRLFEDKKIDILVGTQTITKGYHFPNVTLVGIIWADINLNFPFYNAQESTLQQLIQVAGRAGRENKESKVIVQTMTRNRIFEYLNELEYLNFYEQELLFRKDAGYPPFVRFAEIELKHKNEAQVEKDAFLIASQLIKNRDLRILGPIKPLVAKIKKIHSQKIYIKAQNFNLIHQAFSAIHKKSKSSLFFTPDPLH